MKRIVIIVLFCLAAGRIFGQKKGDTMYVNVQSAPLKASTGFFARTTGTLRYGDQVSVLEIKGKWAQVRSAGQTGWTSLSSLGTKRIIVQGNAQSASAKELALAGKGFTEEVEKEYRTGTDLNYDAVDRLERMEVPEGELLAFIEEGHLARGE